MNQTIIQEWELTYNCNYNCFYCGLIKLKPETDLNKLKNFIKNTLNKNIEVFLSGGEALTHPLIDKILFYLEYFNQPYILQSNFSNYSINKLISIKNLKKLKINLSIHPFEIKKDELINNLKLLKKYKINVQNIDFMYVTDDLTMYFLTKKYFPQTQVSPIFNIKKNKKNCEDCCYWTKKFFEDISFFEKNNINYEKIWINEFKKYRYELWVDQCEGKFSFKNKPCPYYKKYFLYLPNLKLSHCCYGDIDKKVCDHEKCFIM